MATTFKEGDRVQIVDREATADDAKSGLYYNHFRNLTGTVQKVYASQEVAVEIETDSMTEAMAQRHLDVQEQMKSRWLDGLSDEARNRLTDKERDFRLRYTVLVAPRDLKAPDKKAAVTRPAASETAPAPNASASRPKAVPVAPAPAAPRRPTSADYDAAEEAYLQRRKNEG